MAKRCGKYGCGPRANWWRQTLGTDYYSSGEAYSAEAQAVFDLIMPELAMDSM